MAKDRLMHTLTQLIDELFSRGSLDFGPFCSGRMSCKETVRCTRSRCVTKSPTAGVTRGSSFWSLMVKPSFVLCNGRGEKRRSAGRGIRDLSCHWFSIRILQGLIQCSKYVRFTRSHRIRRRKAGHAHDTTDSELATWRFMGSYNSGYTSSNIGYNYSYPTYNPTYNYPWTSKQASTNRTGKDGNSFMGTSSKQSCPSVYGRRAS